VQIQNYKNNINLLSMQNVHGSCNVIFGMVICLFVSFWYNKWSWGIWSLLGTVRICRIHRSDAF
jgi:hypothetical protein